MSKIVTVTAAPGRACPLHRNTARLPGGGMLIVSEGDQVSVPLDAYVRRRIRVGDLVIVKEPSVPKGRALEDEDTDHDEELDDAR